MVRLNPAAAVLALVRRITTAVTKWRRRRACACLRSLLAAFGHDVSELSDDDIERGVMAFAAGVAKCGLSIQEVKDGMARVSSLMRPIGTFPVTNTTAPPDA